MIKPENIRDAGVAIIMLIVIVYVIVEILKILFR